MNPQLTSDLATGTTRDLQRAASQHRRHAESRAPSAVTRTHRPSPLRRRIGFTLIEAGLALLDGRGYPVAGQAADRRYLPS